jgi:hypothetical protein
VPSQYYLIYGIFLTVSSFTVLIKGLKKGVFLATVWSLFEFLGVFSLGYTGLKKKKKNVITIKVFVCIVYYASLHSNVNFSRVNRVISSVFILSCPYS